MPRQAREKSSTGIYHIMVRGINRQTIFEDDEDVCLDYEERHRIADEEIIKLIEEKYRVKKGFFHLMEKEEKNMILKDLKGLKGVTIRQLARVMGVSKYMVEKA